MRRCTFGSPGGGALAIIATERVQLELGGGPGIRDPRGQLNCSVALDREVWNVLDYLVCWGGGQQDSGLGPWPRPCPSPCFWSAGLGAPVQPPGLVNINCHPWYQPQSQVARCWPRRGGACLPPAESPLRGSGPCLGTLSRWSALWGGWLWQPPCLSKPAQRPRRPREVGTDTTA